MSKDRKILYVFFLLATSLLILRLPTLFELPGIDQAAYAYIGQRMREGQLLYRELWDQRLPGNFFFYHWISYLGSDRPWVIPLIDMLYTLPTLGALLLLARSFWGPKAATGAAFIFILFSLSPASQRPWFRNQPEVLMNLPLILCFYGGYRAHQQQKNWPWFFCGLAIGIAFIIKFTALLLALPLILLLWASPPNLTPTKNFRLKRLSYSILGWTIPVAATVMYLYIKGVLPEAYEALVVYNRVYAAYRVELKFVINLALNHWLPGQIVFISAVLLLASLVIWREKLYHSLLGQTLILWILVALFSAFIQGKYLGFHFLSLVPPLSLLAGFSWEWIGKKKNNKNPLASFLLIFLLSVMALGDVSRAYFQSYQRGFAFLFKKTSYEQALHSLPGNAYKLGLFELGKSIARNTEEKDYIYVWALAPEIYYYSSRQTPNRFILHHYLMDAQNPIAKKFPDIKERQQELLNDLKTKPVKFFMVGKGDMSIFEPKDSFSQLKDFPELNQWLQENYYLTTQSDRYLLFQRKEIGR